MKVQDITETDDLIISRDKYEEFIRNSEIGTRWNLKQLAKREQKSELWIKEAILLQPKFAKDFSQMELEGLMHKSTGRGNPWWFKATAITQWIEDNWQRIDWNMKVTS